MLSNLPATSPLFLFQTSNICVANSLIKSRFEVPSMVAIFLPGPWPISQQTPSKLNKKKCTSEHARNTIKKTHYLKQETIKLTTDFLTASRSQKISNILKMLHENNFQPSIICPMKLSSKIRGKSRYFQTSRKRLLLELTGLDNRDAMEFCLNLRT